MSSCRLEIQLCPGLHQKKGDQQVKGGDCPTLFHSHEISTWSTASTSGCNISTPQNKKDMDTLEHVQRKPRKFSEVWNTCCEDRLRGLGLFSLGKRRHRGDPLAPFQYLKGMCREDGGGYFTTCSDSTRGVDLNWKSVGLDWALERNSLI